MERMNTGNRFNMKGDETTHEETIIVVTQSAEDLDAHLEASSLQGPQRKSHTSPCTKISHCTFPGAPRGCHLCERNGRSEETLIFDTQCVDDIQMTSCGQSIYSCPFLLRALWKVQTVTELECRQDRVYDTVQGSKRSLGS